MPQPSRNVPIYSDRPDNPYPSAWEGIDPNDRKKDVGVANPEGVEAGSADEREKVEAGSAAARDELAKALQS